MVKADAAKRDAFVAEYAALSEETRQTGARILFADEAHLRADAELRGKWVLKGGPALVDSTSPRRGEKAGYYSAVWPETDEVIWMEPEGNSNAGTSVAYLMQLKGKHPGPLTVIRDNARALLRQAQEWGGGAGVPQDAGPWAETGQSSGLQGWVREEAAPDFNADEAIWGWVREEATSILCL